MGMEPTKTPLLDELLIYCNAQGLFKEKVIPNYSPFTYIPYPIFHHNHLNVILYLTLLVDPHPISSESKSRYCLNKVEARQWFYKHRRHIDNINATGPESTLAKIEAMMERDEVKLFNRIRQLARTIYPGQKAIHSLLQESNTKYLALNSFWGYSKSATMTDQVNIWADNISLDLTRLDPERMKISQQLPNRKDYVQWTYKEL